MFRTLILSTTALLAATPTFAAEAPKRPHIVITALKTPVEKDKVGSSVTVITREDIEKSGASQVYDVIKNATGVQVNRNGGAGSTSTVRLRGSNPSQVRVMVDGVFMNDTSGANSEFDFNNLLINNIERIEILRGPQSALYGSDAMGGVVNIITRKGEGPATFNAQSEAGSYHTFRNGAGVSGGTGRADYSFQAQHFRSKGFSRLSNTTEKDGARTLAFNGSVGVQIMEGLRWENSFLHSDMESEFDTTTTDVSNHLDKTTSSGRSALKLDTFGGIWQHELSLQAAYTQRDNSEPTSTTNRFSTFDGFDTSIDYLSNVKLRERDVFTLGLTHEKLEGENTSTHRTTGITTTNIDADATINSLYGQYLLGLGEDTTLTVGGRRDNHSQFGGQNTYRVTASRHFESTGTTLRSSVGSGFKAPTLYQLYHPTFGRSTLQPETSVGVDAGIDQHFLNNRLNLSATWFNNRYENLIQFDSPSSSYLNVAKATTQGMETSIQFAVTPELSLHVGYDYLAAEDESTTTQLRRMPKHSALTGLDYEVTDAASIGFDVRYRSRMYEGVSGGNRTYVKGYTTVDLRGSYDINEQVELYSRVENLFDKSYQEAFRYQAPGMSVYVGVKATY